MKIIKTFGLVLTLFALSACTTTGKSYENQVFPKGQWQPVNKQAGAWQ
ncbi:MAG: hypothetical protein IKG79_04160 [Neisseriaceae bacterium]|nr:hypothetical protein [Neisseriaceae bacterium]